MMTVWSARAGPVRSRPHAILSSPARPALAAPAGSRIAAACRATVPRPACTRLLAAALRMPNGRGPSTDARGAHSNRAFDRSQSFARERFRNAAGGFKSKKSKAGTVNAAGRWKPQQSDRILS